MKEIFKMHNTKATLFFTLKIIGLLHSTGTSEVHDKWPLDLHRLDEGNLPSQNSSQLLRRGGSLVQTFAYGINKLHGKSFVSSRVCKRFGSDQSKGSEIGTGPAIGTEVPQYWNHCSKKPKISKKLAVLALFWSKLFGQKWPNGQNCVQHWLNLTTIIFVSSPSFHRGPWSPRSPCLR